MPSAGSAPPSAVVTPQPAHSERACLIARSASAQGHLGGHAHLLEPRLTRLPAMMLQEIGGGGEHVRHALHEIALAVAVIVDGEVEIVARHELRLPDLARPCALHLARASDRRDRGFSAPRSARGGIFPAGGNRRQEWRAHCSVLKSPRFAPKSVSSPQKPTMTGPGTPNSCSILRERRRHVS